MLLRFGVAGGLGSGGWGVFCGGVLFLLVGLVVGAPRDSSVLVGMRCVIGERLLVYELKFFVLFGDGAF